MYELRHMKLTTIYCCYTVHVSFFFFFCVCVCTLPFICVCRLYQLSKESKLPMPAINIHDSVVKVRVL